jgi:hypothetical protein
MTKKEGKQHPTLYLKKRKKKLGWAWCDMPCNSSTREAEEEGSQVGGQPRLHRETLSLHT